MASGLGIAWAQFRSSAPLLGVRRKQRRPVGDEGHRHLRIWHRSLSLFLERGRAENAKTPFDKLVLSLSKGAS